MMQRSLWSTKDTIYDQTISEQHQQLLEMTHVLIDAAEDGELKRRALGAVLALEGYACDHFADQDVCVADLPALEFQKYRRLHSSLLLDLEGLRYQLTARLPGFELNLAKWVLNCLVPHMIDFNAVVMHKVAHMDNRKLEEAGIQ